MDGSTRMDGSSPLRHHRVKYIRAVSLSKLIWPISIKYTHRSHILPSLTVTVALCRQLRCLAHWRVIPNSTQYIRSHPQEDQSSIFRREGDDS